MEKEKVATAAALRKVSRIWETKTISLERGEPSNERLGQLGCSMQTKLKVEKSQKYQKKAFGESVFVAFYRWSHF